MNIKNLNLQLPFNPKDSHCPKLGQYYYALFFILHKMNPEIRSIDILVFLSKVSGKSVHPSWINKKLKQMGCERPIGRPSNEYVAKRASNFQKMDEMTFRIEQLGIPFIIILMDSLGLTNLFVDVIKDLLEDNSVSLPKNSDALSRFIHTLTQIILDQRIHNFEEGMRSEMPHKEMSIERCRQLIKECEKINNLIPSLVDSFLDYWIEKLGLLEKDFKIVIYVDGHGSRYFTKESFVCGRISITGDIAPGTHHVITTTDEGYILILYPESVNTHLNEGFLLSCIHLKMRLGDLVELIVVDRECNGNEFNSRIKDEYAIDTLTGLRSNQYRDINDFQYEWLIEKILAKGQWKDERKRKDDPRTFLLYPQKDKLYVLVTTSQDSKMYEQALSYQKSRWPKNEGVIKILVNELDFNVNVGNGKELVANPKKEKLQLEYDKKLENCKEHINKLDDKLKMKNPPSIEKRLKISKEKWQIREKEYTKECNEKLEKVNDRVYNRKLNPQGLMSILKAGMFNLLMFLISFMANDVEPLSVGVEKITDLLTNRSGIIEERKDRLIFSFTQPDYQKDIELLRKFLAGINKQQLRDKKGRLIFATILPP